MSLGGWLCRTTPALCCCFLEYLFSHICILSPHGQVVSAGTLINLSSSLSDPCVLGNLRGMKMGWVLEGSSSPSRELGNTFFNKGRGAPSQGRPLYKQLVLMGWVVWLSRVRGLPRQLRWAVQPSSCGDVTPSCPSCIKCMAYSMCPTGTN